MEEISVRGKKYVKAKLIARELGYTNDYIGQLCRAGKIDAELVGRTWYVDPDTVKGHKLTRYRSSKASTQRGLQAEVERTKTDPAVRGENFYAHRFPKKPVNIAYEADEAELLPRPKKAIADSKAPVELQVELADAEKLEVDSAAHHYHFEAPEREEIKFFGTLRVTNFITEVPVDGEEHAPQRVAVRGATKTASVEHDAVSLTPEPPKAKKPPVSAPSLHKDSRSHRVPVHIGPVTIPVAVEDEEMSLPIAYHLFTAGSFVAAFMLAAVAIGLEAHVMATKASVVTKYSFVADHLAALIYLVK